MTPIMKQVILACSIVLAIACNQNNKPAEKTHAPMPEPPAMAEAATSDKWPDPVCRMPYDTSYKEWAVYQKDTVHFCSITCKEIFQKAPEKYMAKLKK
ncbi:hypothetical protein DF182_10480 [Chitinophaga flava]|uniref:YHS domain-containing protein n=2 Tax=Chitinophaga flava TaxID=2259036 RepID=A0A365Y4Q6_9BACT|nr:hypothetical protein DF182_10480 [Chitinophaga flava]